MAVARKDRPRTPSKFAAFFTTGIGRKYLTGVTGLLLVGFVIAHLLGNLVVFAGDDGEAFNAYGHFLHGLGPAFYAIEVALLGVILLHAYLGVQIWLGKRRARPVDYKKYQSVGGASKQTLSSRSMIVTGVVLLVFLVIHVWSFRFGAFYETSLSTGEAVRDLYRLVVEKFQSPLYAFGYVIVMILLGFHLRHGIWSALQSLGAMRPSLAPAIYSAALVLAVLLAFGFLVLPLYIFFAVDPSTAAAAPPPPIP